MSKKANPAVLGGFVLGGLAILAVGLVVLGGTRWFEKRDTVVAYFPGSIKGLRIGAPVTFRGVSIGEVTDIKVLFASKSIQVWIPVVFEMDPRRIIEIDRDDSIGDVEFRQRLIDQGFRAQLDLESVVTGILSINLDFFPDASPPEFHNEQQFSLPYPEVPSIPSDLQVLQTDAGKIAQQLEITLGNLNQLLPELQKATEKNSDKVESIVGNVAEFTENLNEAWPKIAALVDDGSAVMATMERTADSLGAFVLANKSTFAETLTEVEGSLVALRRLADQANNLIAENREGVQDFTQTGLYEFTGLAEDAQRAVNQITRVLDELERDPSRLLFGNSNQGIQP